MHLDKKDSLSKDRTVAEGGSSEVSLRERAKSFIEMGSISIAGLELCFAVSSLLLAAAGTCCSAAAASIGDSDGGGGMEANDVSLMAASVTSPMVSSPSPRLVLLSGSISNEVGFWEAVFVDLSFAFLEKHI